MYINTHYKTFIYITNNWPVVIGLNHSIRPLPGITFYIRTWMFSQIAKFIGPTWGPQGSCRTQLGPTLAPWTLLLGLICNYREWRCEFRIWSKPQLQYWFLQTWNNWVTFFQNVILLSNVISYKCSIFYLKLVEWNKYFVTTTDTAGQVH